MYEHANLFELNGKMTTPDGKRRIHVTYSTTSLDGQPHLVLDDGKKQHVFRGRDQIQTAETALGNEVTVMLNIAMDAWVKKLTLLIPVVHVPAETMQAQLATCGIFATHYTNIGGPEMVRGALASYEAVDLHGTAKAVRF